jgi:hypothetical protein
MSETTKPNDAREAASSDDQADVETSEMIALDQLGDDDRGATIETASEVSQPEAPDVVAAETIETADASLVGAVRELSRETRELRDTVSAMQTRIAAFEAAMDATAKQVSFLPPQMRMLGGKIDGLATAISEPRYRAALLGLLGVYDLADQILRTLPADDDGQTGVANHRRNYEVLLAQLRQILEANGLTEIPTDGGFDPELHRALKLVPVADPAQSDQVLETVRRGFRTEQSVLRYAEVLVGQYSPPAIVADSSTND